LGWVLGATSHTVPSTAYQQHLLHLLQRCLGGNWGTLAESPGTFEEKSVAEPDSMKMLPPGSLVCSDAFTGCYNPWSTRTNLRPLL